MFEGELHGGQGAFLSDLGTFVGGFEGHDFCTGGDTGGVALGTVARNDASHDGALAITTVLVVYDVVASVSEEVIASVRIVRVVVPHPTHDVGVGVVDAAVDDGNDNIVTIVPRGAIVIPHLVGFDFCDIPECISVSHFGVADFGYRCGVFFVPGDFFHVSPLGDFFEFSGGGGAADAVEDPEGLDVGHFAFCGL